MTNEFEIDTRRLLKGVLKKSWLIGLTALLCAGAVLLCGVALTGETYTAEVTFCVDTGAEQVTNQTLIAARELADSCGVLLQTRSFLDAVAQRSSETVDGAMLTGSAVNETEFFRVSVRADSAEAAGEIAAAVEEVLPELAKEYLSGARLKVVDPAGAAHRAKVDYVNLLASGALLGILLSGIPVTVAELRKLR